MLREGRSFSCVLSPKCESKVGFWNVRSLQLSSFGLGKAEEVCRNLEKLKVCVCGLADVGSHLRGSGQQRLGEWTLHWSGAPEGATGWQPSVGLLLAPEAAAALTDLQSLGPRLLRARFAGCTSLSVLVAYAPTSQHPDEQAAFLSQLAAAQAALPPRDVQLVLGDFNARVGSAGAGDPYLGCSASRHGVGDRNAAGEQLLQWCAEAGLAVANTWFPHKAAHSYTWLSADQQTRACIDYALVSRQRLSSVQDVRAHRQGNLLAPLAGSISDHHLLVLTLLLRLRVRPPRQPRPELSLLRDPTNPAAVRYAAELDALLWRQAAADQQPPPSPPPSARGLPSSPTTPLAPPAPLPSLPPAPAKPMPADHTPLHPTQAHLSPPPAPSKPPHPAPSPLPTLPAPAPPRCSLAQLAAASHQAAAMTLPPSTAAARQPWINRRC